MKLTTHVHPVLENNSACNYTSALPYSFMTWCLVKHNVFMAWHFVKHIDNFKFSFTSTNSTPLL